MPTDPEVILGDVRWQPDQIVNNHFSERVWLKALIGADGEQYGITDCCLADEPCDRHKEMEEKTGDSQHVL